MSGRDAWALTSEMFLSEAEVEAVRQSLNLREAEAERSLRRAVETDRLMFEVLTFSGLRNSEFCRLRVSDTPVVLKQPALRVSETPRQDRLVAIPEFLVRLISEYVEQVRPGLLADSMSAKDVTQPLVLNERGRAFDRTTLYRRVVRILSAAGLEARASVQLLRHTYGYLAYKRTQGNLLFVQRQLGHAHPMVTAVYADFVEFSNAELANLAGGVTPRNPDEAAGKPASKPATAKRKKGRSS